MSVVARQLARDEDDVIAGLRSHPKRLPCRLLYDAIGAELFERITQTDAYYPTRTEQALLDAYLPAIAREVGPRARVIEPGSGAGIKTRRLLAKLDHPASYVAIDVSREQLEHTATRLHQEQPDLEVEAIAADFTRAFTLPAPRSTVGRSLVFFPGSTIGNFEPFDAVAFLRRFQRFAGPRGLLLLGADGTRERDVLVRAYDDEQGVTAAFNTNLLAHLNRARGANFDLTAFDHRAVWNELRSRVEMHLVSRRAQTVRVGNESFELAAGEPLVTEYAYKHTALALRSILAAAGWRVREVYTGAVHPMRLWLCESASTR
ncbi:MAG: L-histidine N(alpha)-methyltransferase [Myxococcales bacterium]|nr:L-histidine N(alpha)-methyltransferase [Myxococcales bacterium]